MIQAKDDPEGLDDFAPAESLSPYTIEGYRRDIRRLTGKLNRIRSLVRLAHGLSADERVRKILKDALEVKP